MAAARVELDASRKMQVLSLKQAAIASEFRADAYGICIHIFDKSRPEIYDTRPDIDCSGKSRAS
jgi:hypothetical protein